jgi:ubiquinone biosynthesis accessory factor UbiJ
MLSNLHELLAPTVLERVTLLANHVLSREPAAMQRLKGHAGALLQVVAHPWPTLLPKPPVVTFTVTPAGLLEWCPTPGPQAPHLKIVVDAANPAAVAWQLATGKMPSAQVEGDSRLAGDVDWLLAHVRWDLMDDLEATFGPAVAQGLNVMGQTLRATFSEATRRAGEMAGQFRRSPP